MVQGVRSGLRIGPRAPFGWVTAIARWGITERGHLF